ncbi:hypothetical protein [Apilactobacillus timberlakei]|uniref:Uncharacterized protein n=1 Tax=Apilactobacillus timberlakei TaxID=2008380 RepID=A0ABY2YRZ4_9LACO|nr:hypothetical protein [Apilactobacillus timberlakei]TPR12611.1 hypothetical protein DYZ97_06000 [Apilactobacillus timberlakei]TPR13442.1 hypothetical protein DY048_05920 [Apilactobacillus timberlakei]TPR15515.1 hypothetical protein DY052_05205 [Apilactobacillus timberlakei]
MIYIIGYTVSLIGLLMLLFSWKKFFPKLDKLQKFAFSILSLGIIVPMIYGFVIGFISNVK